MRLNQLVETTKNVSLKLPTPSFISHKTANVLSEEQWTYVAKDFGKSIVDIGVSVISGSHDGSSFRVVLEEAKLTKELVDAITQKYKEWDEKFSWNEVADIPGIIGESTVFPIPQGVIPRAYSDALQALFDYEFPDFGVADLDISHATGCVVVMSHVSKNHYLSVGGVLVDNLPKAGSECLSKLFKITSDKLKVAIQGLVGDEKAALRITQGLLLGAMGKNDAELMDSLGKPLVGYKQDLMQFLDAYEYGVIAAWFQVDENGTDK